LREGENPMGTIVYEWFLKEDGASLEVRITKDRSDSYIVSEAINAPPSSAVIPEYAIHDREFATEAEAVSFVEETHIPGRRSQGWILIDGL
jgi:hypothetical protein